MNDFLTGLNYKIESMKKTLPEAEKHLVILHTITYNFFFTNNTTILSIVVIHIMNYAK
jgi:hypothetical protein